jgi:hypothetical protein
VKSVTSFDFILAHYAIILKRTLKKSVNIEEMDPLARKARIVSAFGPYIAVFFHTRENPSLSPGPETGYLERGFPQSFQASAEIVGLYQIRQ